MKKIIALIAIALFFVGCSTPCDSRVDKVKIEYDLVNGKTATRVFLVPHRSDILLSNNMVLYHTRGCSSEWKLSHKADCAGGRYGGRTRISLGVVNYRILSRNQVR